MNSRLYTFDDRYAMSVGVAINASIADILVSQIPGAVSAWLAKTEDDRSGVDWWVQHVRGAPLAVDIKAREDDYAMAPPNGHKTADDLALERWSVVEKEKVGWTLDEHKRCDYILWFWRSTGRWCLVPFSMLCAIFREHLTAWEEQYQHARQWTPCSGGGGYHSECIFVPRKVVWRAIYLRFAGQPNSPA